MIVRIDCNEREHSNFYEGSHIGFHPSSNGQEIQVKGKTGKTWEEGLVVIVEGQNGKNCVTIEVDGKSNTQIYLMNDQGKTVEKIFI